MPASPQLVTNHWGIPYLGKKWVSGARGPDTFDCWGLLWWIKREHFRQDVPIYPGIDATDLFAVCKAMRRESEGAVWVRLATPRDGCAVAMSRRGDQKFHHVGIWAEIDGGMVLHAADHSGVRADTLKALKTSGVGRIEFYEHGAYC